MGTLTAHFDLPETLSRGLESGLLERVGGVIRERKSGQVVSWLREAADGRRSGLLSPAGLLSGLAPMVSAVASVVNVGVTAGFGIATLRRLGRLQEGVTRIEDGVTDVQQRATRIEDGVERARRESLARLEALLLGQVALLTALEESVRRDEVATLGAAVQLLSSLDGVPDDQARSRADKALFELSKLRIKLEKDLSLLIPAAIESLAKRELRGRLSIAVGELGAILRMRELAGMLALEAQAYAVSGQCDHAARRIRDTIAVLEPWTTALSTAFFGDRNKNTFWDDLLNAHWARNGVPPLRVERLARRYGPGGLAQVLMLIQSEPAGQQPSSTSAEDAASAFFDSKQIFGGEVIRQLLDALGEWKQYALHPRVTGVVAHVEWSDAARDRLVPFLDQLEGLDVDLENLRGLIAEYEHLAGADTTLRDHAARFDGAAISPRLRIRLEEEPEATNGIDSAWFVDEEVLGQLNEYGSRRDPHAAR